ncbi:DUF2076 family protein [Sphingomonas sp. CROZ-RG-20F-R02-07]|uniref:DUF2076 family protein n=1 Tax=Sphingomonas sp. CROZ-RG-20F-R02-07 TaxID=2914832 RepID=UPI001F58D6C6|nr:DUF2076 family protein [Sphingomonas sp. CROZ-RG-20F-R02-07]
MNTDERALLSRFLEDLASTRAGPKDAEADGLIRQALAANPDAAYLLVQHAIVADQSLHAAQQRIAELEQQQQQAAPASASFLPQGGAGPWGTRTAQPYAPPPPDDRPGIFSGGGGLGSFLRTAGTTAAGVAGGEMLFSGLSDLFGHRGGGMFGGGQGFMGAPQDVTINNYGDDERDDGDYDDGN